MLQNWRLLVHCVLICSCKFESDEEFVVEIDQSQIARPSIDFNSSTDTIYVRGSVTLGIDIAEVDDVTEFVVSIGSIEVGRGESNGRFVHIESEEFSDGYYPISLVVYTQTNTGSIGDQFGIEVIATEIKKVVLIDNAPVFLQVIGFEEIDGVLKFSWDEYKGFKFEEYRLTIFGPNGTFSETIRSKTKTSVEISDYIGGDIYANFSLIAKGEEVTTNTSFSDDLGLHLGMEGENLNLTLLPNPYSDFDHYELEHDNDLSGSSFPTIYSLENRAYSEEALSTYFEYPVNYDFALFAVSSDGTATYLGGNSFNDERYKLHYDNGLRYYFYEKTILHLKLDEDETFSIATLYDEEGEIIRTLSGKIALSPNGHNLYEFRQGTVIKYDPSSLLGIEAFEPNIIMEGDFRWLFVSNEEKLLFYNFNSHDPFGQRTFYSSYFYDVATETQLQSWGHSSRLFPAPASNLLSKNGMMVDSDQFFISYFPYNSSKIPDIYNGVRSTQSELSGVPRLVAPLHTVNAYLVAEGSVLNKQDYVGHAVERSLDFGVEIIEIFSNFDDLCSVILFDSSNYYLVVLRTATLEEVQRIPFNGSILDGEKYMSGNRVFFEGRNLYVYDFEVNQ